MFKTASAAAAAALFALPAFASGPVVNAGQYAGTTQYTATIDPSGMCAGLGVTPGKITSSVATIGGLGNAWTSTIANPGAGTSAVPYAVTWINCAFPALPAASAFTASSIGGVTGAAETIYTNSPVGQQTTNCFAPSTTAGLKGGANYTLVSGNGNDTNGTPQTNSVTVIPTNGTGKDYGFKVTTGNTQLNVLGSLVCYLSTDALYVDTQK